MNLLERFLRFAVGAGCAYEILALASQGTVPTISSLCWRATTHHGRLTVVALLSLLAWHLLGTGPLARPKPTQ